MKRGALISIMILFLSLNLCTFSLAGSLDGTMWMHEKEDGTRHCVAFYEDYQYLTGAASGQEFLPWARSTFPYFSNTNPDGSINYSGIIIFSSIVWAITWGTCDINSNHASYNAFLILFFIIPLYAHMEPYTLESTDWTPPSSSYIELKNFFIDAFLPSIYEP